MIQNLFMIRKKTSYGMTLLEVLVAILVVGLGLAVVLSMMLAANRSAEAAEYRAIAVREAQAIADKMSVNALGAYGYVFGNFKKEKDVENEDVYVAEFKQMGYVADTEREKLSKDVDCTTCTTRQELRKAAELKALERAEKDMDEWLIHLQTVLPNGQAAIKEEKKYQRYTIVIMWQQRQENSLENENVAAEDRIVFDVSL